MTYVIAISNEKGGVAKTTSALSLGGALADLGKKILMIDLDAQANLTLAFGLKTGDISMTAGDLLLSSAALQDCIQPTHHKNIDLVPSKAQMEQAEQLLPVYLNYGERLRNAITEAMPLPYDYIIVDCPPMLGAVTRNALVAANLLIIPTQSEFFSAYALRTMMQTVQNIRAGENPYLAYRILVTMYDRRNRTHREIYEQLQKTFADGLFKTIIEIDTKLRESPILGLPINQYTPKSRGAQQYRALAQELLNYVEKETN